MTLYQNPNTIEGNFFYGFYVRRGELIALGPTTNQPRLDHLEIARRDGLLDGWRLLARAHSDQLDAGAILISKPGRSIMLDSQSGILNAPTVREGRIQTGIILRRLSPGFEVEVKHPGPHWYRR